jgi:long-chain fatty acid transport protein
LNFNATGTSYDKPDETLKQKLPTWFLPNFYGVFNFGPVGPGTLALYLQAGVPAGGGTLDWNDGTAGTTNALTGIGGLLATATGDGGFGVTAFGGAKIGSQKFSATSIYYGAGLGGAYAFLDDKLSLSLGGRFVMARRSFSLEAEYINVGAETYTLSGEFEYNAWGITPIAGISVRPVEGLTLSARYEMETRLEFEYEQKKLAVGGDTTYSTQLGQAATGVLNIAGVKDGDKFNQNLPHIIALGAEYALNDALTLSLSGTAYLLSVADLNGVEDDFGIGWEAGLGLTYKLLEGLKLGAGFMYTDSGAKDSYFSNNDYLLNASANAPIDSIAFGLGGTCALKNGLSFTLTGLWSHYLPADYDTTSKAGSAEGTYKKDVINVGIGVGYHY